MSTLAWLVVIVVGIKLPLVAILLWVPFRSDSARVDDDEVDGGGDDDGGAKAPPNAPSPLPHGPLRPDPHGSLHRPPRRRGPHDGSPASPPSRTRTPLPVRTRLPAVTPETSGEPVPGP